MERTRAKIDFGKIDYNGTGRRYPVTVEIELKEHGGDETFTVDPVTKKHIPTGEKTPVYTEFTASAMIGARCGGQCLDEIAKHLKNEEFTRIYTWWKKYHLNGMNAGTPEQEAAIEAWKACGNRYDYTAACDFLKSIDLYEIPFTGLSIGREYHGELYRYGTAWIIETIPADTIAEIRAYIESKNAERR